MIQKNSYFFLKDTCCVPFTFMSAPAALLMASYVFGIAVVFQTFLHVPLTLLSVPCFSFCIWDAFHGILGLL